MSRQEQNTFRVRPKPFTLAMLDDIDGGQEGLLPKSTHGKPLKVEFEPWSNTDPTPEFPESVELFWNGRSVDIKRWTAPIASHDYYIDVPASWLTHGPHEVEYKLTLGTSQTEPSEVRILTVDTEPPVLSNTSSELIFPFQVRPPSAITAAYLTANADRVEAEVPRYGTAQPGDVIVGYWKNLANNTSHEFRSAPLTSNDYTDPVVLTFTGDFLRDTVGDGQRQVVYRVEDRAGNPSLESLPVDLLVAAIRPPRFAPHPWVAEIEEDTPSGWGELKAENALKGATVRLPEEAVYYDDDRVEVQFGEPDAVDSITVLVPWGTRDIRIPKEHIAAYFNKELPVYYNIHLPDDSTLKSGELTLAIRPPSSFLYAPQLVSPHSDPVYKTNIPTTGLPLLQRKWAFISTRCLITMTVSGTGTDNQSKSLTILNEHPVSESQVNDGVNAVAPRSFMLTLKDGARFIVKAKVSFDGGESWFNSSELRPMLQS